MPRLAPAAPLVVARAARAARERRVPGQVAVVVGLGAVVGAAAADVLERHELGRARPVPGRGAADLERRRREARYVGRRRRRPRARPRPTALLRQSRRRARRPRRRRSRPRSGTRRGTARSRAAPTRRSRATRAARRSARPRPRRARRRSVGDGRVLPSSLARGGGRRLLGFRDRVEARRRIRTPRHAF